MVKDLRDKQEVYKCKLTDVIGEEVPNCIDCSLLPKLVLVNRAATYCQKNVPCARPGWVPSIVRPDVTFVLEGEDLMF